jgi:hypothetical protein
LELNGDDGASLGGKISGKEHALYASQTVMARPSNPIDLSHTGGYAIEGRMVKWVLDADRKNRTNKRHASSWAGDVDQ